VKPIVVEGVTYIPVHTAPESVNKSSAIVPKKTGHIDTFKVGKITYIPLNVIPKVHRKIFKPVKKVSPPVIKINGKFYIPEKKNAKPIVVEGRTYIPVHTAPSHLNTSSSIGSVGIVCIIISLTGLLFSSSCILSSISYSSRSTLDVLD
jgi:hypothetical protein